MWCFFFLSMNVTPKKPLMMQPKKIDAAQCCCDCLFAVGCIHRVNQFRMAQKLCCKYAERVLAYPVSMNSFFILVRIVSKQHIHSTHTHKHMNLVYEFLLQSHFFEYSFRLLCTSSKRFLSLHPFYLVYTFVCPYSFVRNQFTFRPNTNVSETIDNFLFPCLPIDNFPMAIEQRTVLMAINGTVMAIQPFGYWNFNRTHKTT